ncbi:hypothetical protein BHE74_00003506 [Ensete ventricosum]|nr:hypothetical protein GW17_00006013 [Ensete ventricosum]RWW87645.1 hypothetical protein BHE74_00003506 [Ensete ventricosum]
MSASLRWRHKKMQRRRPTVLDWLIPGSTHACRSQTDSHATARIADAAGVEGRSRGNSGRKMKGNGAEDLTPGLPPPLEWKFSQVFGERAAGEEVQEGTIFPSPLSDRFLTMRGQLRVSSGLHVLFGAAILRFLCLLIEWLMLNTGSALSRDNCRERYYTEVSPSYCGKDWIL